MKHGMQWPLGIVAVLALSAGGQIWFAVVASRDEAFAVEGDYYNKAIHWDVELAQRQQNARLGWRIVPALQLDGGGGEGALSVELRDADGAPVTGADVQVLAMHNARAARQLSASLAEVGGGTYRTPLLARRSGEWELRFSVRRGTQRFSASERVDAVVR
ncbi:MAG: FixH family protein [Gemmatimonadaceae bacterium]|nr:FixH family protein [Gemmatimonadaceae bacterium]